MKILGMRKILSDSRVGKEELRRISFHWEKRGELIDGRKSVEDDQILHIPILNCQTANK